MPPSITDRHIRYNVLLAEALTICLVETFSRFHRLAVAIPAIKVASACPSKWRAASWKISSGTGSTRSLIRVTASLRARAARSLSWKYGASRHADTASRRSLSGFHPSVL